jgi:anti-sigma B factor antagonist
MKLGRQEIRGVPVVGLNRPTEIDIGNVEDFKSGFLEQLNGSERVVVFDASQIGFFDSAGMSALLSIQKHLQQHHGEIVLAALNRSVLEVFRMVGFDLVFRNHPTVDEALESLQQSGSPSPGE